MNPESKKLIYQTEDGGFQTEVRLQSETIWLTQKQISDLFQTSTDNISLHLKNIYSEGELQEKATTEDYSVVQTEGVRQVKRLIKHYNLDAIISIGYKVNSKKGTQFRIWANDILKQYLLQGYSLNEQKLRKQSEQLYSLRETLKLFQNVQQDSLESSEAKGLLNILTQYTHGFILLNQFDTGNFPKDGLNTNITQKITFDEAINAIALLKKELMEQKEAGSLFGNLKDDGFKGILGNIVLSFDGSYLYPSVEEQAAHLLYFSIKNHPFSDGNKRIGAFIFIWFLEKNRHNLKRNGDVKINDNVLVAIALLVAQSHPNQKDIMIDLIVNLIKE